MYFGGEHVYSEHLHSVLNLGFIAPNRFSSELMESKSVFSLYAFDRNSARDEFFLDVWFWNSSHLPDGFGPNIRLIKFEDTDFWLYLPMWLWANLTRLGTTIPHTDHIGCIIMDLPHFAFHSCFKSLVKENLVLSWSRKTHNAGTKWYLGRNSGSQPGMIPSSRDFWPNVPEVVWKRFWWHSWDATGI